MLEGTHLFEETLDARRISFEPPEAEQSYASLALCHYSYWSSGMPAYCSSFC